MEEEFDYTDAIAALDTQIAQEEKMWEVQHLNPSMVNVNTYLLNMKMRMMVKLLEVKFGMTEDEINVYFKEAVLAQLKEDRKMITKAMAQQKLQQPGHLPFKGIIGPNGTPL